MLDATLTRIQVPGPVSRPDLRIFVESLRSLSRAPGFVRSQVFRGLEATDVVLLVAQWSNRDAARVLAHRNFDPASPFPAAGPQTPESIYLASSFEMELVRERAAATLLRVATGRSPVPPGGEARDRELALRVMAAPGSIRASGAQSERRSVTACRIDFDAEDAVWHFLDSPLRHEWSALAAAMDQEECWSLNLPRFNRSGRVATPVAAPSVPVEETPLVSQLRGDDPLSVELVIVSPNSAELRLSGRLGERGARRVQAVVRSLAGEGCRSLVLDLCEVESATPPALQVLLGTARWLKAQGGQFHLRERDRRFRLAARPVSLARTASLLTHGPGDWFGDG